MEKHILVTGGAGFIGSHLVERLLASGRAVTVIDDCSTGAWTNLAGVPSGAKLTRISGKVSEVTGLRELVENSEAIFHLAAVVGVELVIHSSIQTIETNLLETKAILSAASEFRVPIVITSTSEVYGKSIKPEFSEDDDLLIGPPHLSRWSYACSKLMDEFLALAHARDRGLPVVIARLFNTVGPRQTGRFGMVLPRFIQAARRGEPLRVYGNGEQTRCFCFVGDVVEALLALQQQEAARGQVFNIGSSDEITIVELAREVIRTLGSGSIVEYVPYEKAYAPGFEDMMRRRPNVEKLRRVTGMQPSTSLRRIIEVTAASMGSQE